MRCRTSPRQLHAEASTGQWFDSVDGQHWWFDSGSIALDFAYTGGFDGPQEWEQWRGPQDLAGWWCYRFDVDVPVGPAAYRRARELRGAVASAAPGRIRACAADDCGLVFCDTSRSGSRTWCSMRRCGNRHKVRQSRARRRTQT